MPTIAIDALGGVNAPRAPVEAAAYISRTTQIGVVLAGDPAAIEPHLATVSYDPERLRIHAADPGPSPDTASVRAAVSLVASGQADALVSAGAPSVALRACIEGLGRFPGVRRAPLAAVYPTAPRPGNRDPFALILDVGATTRATAEDLVTWARMGAAYASRISRVEAPTVGLLSVGRDPGAGPPEVACAHAILAADPNVRFVGNVEGIDIPAGAADVVVCDGFVGQVLIGVFSGLGEAIVSSARSARERRITWRVGLRLLEGAVKHFSELVEHASYGGAPLLGFERVAIIALPSASSRSLANSVRLAAKAFREDVPAVVRRALEGYSGGPRA